ncbi:MAG: alpha-galactosidase [Chthonomonadales bacterium]|nr:alpha-galactosidase [Chthonomonadales bacterium]
MLTTIAIVACAMAAGAPPTRRDWLVEPAHARTVVRRSAGGREVTLANGLARRTFRVAPNWATVGLDNLVTGASLLRGVKPEAVMALDGVRYAIGGLIGQPDYAYLDPRWLDAMPADPAAFRVRGWRAGATEAPYPWKPARHAPDAPWPPRGRALIVEFAAPPGRHAGIAVTVRYEMYDGLPVLAKWIRVRNGGTTPVEVTGLETEVLAINEQEKARLHVESSYAFAGMETTAWGTDPDYATQVDYERRAPLLLTSRYPLGPGVLLPPGGTFESFGTVEALLDSDDRERQGLTRRRLYRALAPQTAENPIFMHVRSSDSASVRLAIDQCAEVGFEMVILTFWSGFEIENLDPTYLARVKADVDYAHTKGIQVGGYTLMCASRDVGPESNCVSPDTGAPGSKFGQSACLASRWADGYFERVLRFIDATGIDVIETDGPYHGDVCASTTHAHHRGLADSQVRQWEACSAFYRECRRRGIYVNTPDWYYLSGSNKCGMGYRETNFSLPRDRQILIARQNIYDGTFGKTASMGWMFVPLVEYHGGGPAATLEPLSEHLADYEWHLAQNFGSGVMAAYRGPRLYDTDATRELVRRWVGFYKRHRAILDSDIVHLRRPDRRDLDAILHVNPRLDERALLMVYNPTARAIRRRLRVPLHYAGLSGAARFAERGGRAVTLALDDAQAADLPVRLASGAITWFIVRAAARTP